MDNLLKILPLMNMPEAIRQPLLLDALAGKGNAMVGFIAARQASDAATSVVAEKDQATAANATTMARLATFHAALVKTGTLPDDLEVFDAFKTKLLANEASATAVGSSIICKVVDEGPDPALEDVIKERDQAWTDLKTAEDNRKAAEAERKTAEADLKKVNAANERAMKHLQAFHARLTIDVELSNDLGSFDSFKDQLFNDVKSARAAGAVIRAALSNTHK